MGGQVPDRRTIGAGGRVPLHRPLLDGDEHGVRRERLGHRRQRERPVDVPRGGGDGAVGQDDGGPDMVDGPVEHGAHGTGEIHADILPAS